MLRPQLVPVAFSRQPLPRGMPDDTDPVLDAVEALRARGILATPVGDDFERWLIGDLSYSDADVVRLAERIAGKPEE